MSFLGANTNSLARPGSKLFGVDNSQGATHQEARPVPYVAGNRRVGVTWLSDAINIRVKKGGGHLDSVADLERYVAEAGFEDFCPHTYGSILVFGARKRPAQH